VSKQTPALTLHSLLLTHFFSLIVLQASIEAGVAVCDMSERRFLEVLAQREVVRRQREAAHAGDGS
jgi:hypothetical protein